MVLDEVRVSRLQATATPGPKGAVLPGSFPRHGARAAQQAAATGLERLLRSTPRRKALSTATASFLLVGFLAC